MPRRPTSSSTGTTAPRNRTPQPVRVRQRSFGDAVKAFLAFVALFVLLVGVPFALATQIGWPLPNEVPSLDRLRQAITVQAFLNILTVVVWLAWAQFTACVLVEMKAALSGVGVPGRVPGAGPSQLLARQLVAALLLVGATAASSTSGLSQLGQGYDVHQRPAVAAAQQTSGLFAQQKEQAAGAASALVETMEAETRQRRGAPGAAGQDSVLTGRTGPAQHTRWAPHLVLLAAEPSAEDAVRQAELAADASRLGIGCLVGTETGDPDRLAVLATDLVGRSGARGLPPRTEALLDELLPTWRDTIAAAG